MQRWLGILLGIFWSVGGLWAQIPDASQAVQSRSGQFVVYGMASTAQPRADWKTLSTATGNFPWFELSQNHVIGTPLTLHLTPPIAAVSCERIRDVLLKEMEWDNQRPGRIYVFLNPKLTAETMKIFVAPFPSAWLYAVELPPDLPEKSFTSAILQILLVERINRGQEEQKTELPDWLFTGLISHLQAVSPGMLALSSNLKADQSRTNLNPAVRLRESFANAVPLTFEEMSWPHNLAPERRALFQNSAQLFMYELLRFKEGKAALRKFFEEIPRHQNWQFAFLKAYDGHFKNLLEVEKWWALQNSLLVGRDPTRLWTATESWQKFKEALDIPVQIHLRVDRLPVAGVLSLQEVLRQWDSARQEVALRQALTAVVNLRARVQPELVPLVDDYRQAIGGYLTEKNRKPRTIFDSSKSSPAFLKNGLIRKLDELDAKRMKFHESLVATNPPAAVKPVQP